MGRTKTKPFLKRKKVPKLYFHFWPPQKCPPFFFLIHTWWCENITASPCETNSYNDIIDSPCLILIIRIRNKTDEQNKNHTHTPLKYWIKPKSIRQDRKTRYQKLDTRTPTQYRKLDTRTPTQYRKLDTRTPTQYRKLDITYPVNNTVRSKSKSYNGNMSATSFVNILLLDAIFGGSNKIMNLHHWV
jgi:hypothetical protein